MTRHWSFVATDKKYLYPACITLICIGGLIAFFTKDPTQLSRVGNFVIGIGVWMSMRYSLREGINRHKDASDNSPVIPGSGGQINSKYFANISFSIGDAILQVHGFILVVIGSFIGSYGDLLLKNLFPKVFSN